MMTGYSGTSKIAKLHNYYMFNNANKKLCDKKPVQKDYIEDIVIEQANYDNIKKIAETVVALASKEKENTTLKRLNKLLKENKKQKANLFDSLKICDIDSIKRSIFEEINKMDIEYERIKNEIAIEESQCVKITVG